MVGSNMKQISILCVSSKNIKIENDNIMMIIIIFMYLYIFFVTTKKKKKISKYQI